MQFKTRYLTTTKSAAAAESRCGGTATIREEQRKLQHVPVRKSWTENILFLLHEKDVEPHSSLYKHKARQHKARHTIDW